MAAISVLPSCSTNETCNNLLPVEVEPPSQEQNILTEADPTIFMDTDSTYYLYGTGSQSDKGFLVYHSNDLNSHCYCAYYFSYYSKRLPIKDNQKIP